MSFPPFTASREEATTASQTNSRCYSHSAPLLLPRSLLIPHYNQPAPIRSFIPTAGPLSGLHTILPHLLTHAVDLPHLPSRCFKTCYLRAYGKTSDLYGLTLPRQLPLGPPKSQRKDILSLVHRTYLPLYQAQTHSHPLLQQNKTSRKQVSHTQERYHQNFTHPSALFGLLTFIGL